MWKAKKPARRRKKQSKKVSLLFLFLIGFVIAAYPIVSQLYYQMQAEKVTQNFDQTVKNLKNEDLEKRYRLAQAFNSTLKPAELVDPYTASEKKAGVTEYANMLKINELIGYVEVPKISQEIPMYVGTTHSVLEQGAGLLEGTSLPVGGKSTHTVITAHRGLPTAKLFTDLNKMKKGDVFYIHVLDKVLAYEVDQILVVEPNDFDAVLIEQNKDYATLLTCTPYMVNSHRLLVRGKRIPYTAPVKEVALQVQRATRLWSIAFIVSMVLILVLVFVIYRNRKVVKQQAKRLEESHAKG